MSEHSKQIEALLFALGRPVSRKELGSMLGADAKTLELAIAELVKNNNGRGVVGVDDGKEVELRAAPEAAELIERVRKEEFTREIGRAGSEALAAVLYRGPLTRSEIDFIRGVNSSQTLRTLLMRGLLRKVQNPRDERSYLYEPTTELLSQLGVSHPDELPDYEVVRSKLVSLEEAYKKAEI
ncbi:MAG: SMC-Scp complex subunit ScpB [Patescibacteria group bacterium]|nr:SMC-Scp complex subunit ScpB [Patescibacteria group bacterium]